MDDEPEDWWIHQAFPPTAYPVREAFTFCLVAALVLGIIGYGLWALAERALEVWG